MKTNPATTTKTLATFIALCSLLSCSASAGKPVKDKPGGGGDGGDGPSTNNASVDYELTWFASPNKGYRIDTINSSGIAIGRIYSVGSLYSEGSFWTTADGTINPLDNWWNLPIGYEDWRMGRGEKGMNDANQVTGVIVNDANSAYKLFTANLLNSNSLQVIGDVPSNAQRFCMNDHGDLAFTGAEGISLYVRATNQIHTYPSISHFHFSPTGLNRNLQLSALTFNRDFDTNGNGWDGCGRLTFDRLTGAVTFVEELAYAPVISKHPLAYAMDIDEAGTVYGAYEDTNPKGRGRTSTAKAGFVLTNSEVTNSEVWHELDGALPQGSDSAFSVEFSACALKVNGSGQILGGYNVQGGIIEDLWLRDATEGLFKVDDLVIGESTTDVAAFRAADNLRNLALTETDDTNYGTISGYQYSGSGNYQGFILTPKLKTQ